MTFTTASYSNSVAYLTAPTVWTFSGMMDIPLIFQFIGNSLRVHTCAHEQTFLQEGLLEEGLVNGRVLAFLVLIGPAILLFTHVQSTNSLSVISS